MATLPFQLFQQVRTALGRSEYFASYQTLSTLFAGVAELSVLLPRLNWAPNTEQLVEFTVRALLENEMVGQGSLLPTFLDIMRQSTLEGSQLRADLDAVYIQVRDHLARQAGAPLPPPAVVRVSDEAVLQSNTGGRPMTWIRDAELLVQRAKAVARVRVPYLSGGPAPLGVETGTAWLVGPRLALTCWHVVATTKDRNDRIDENILRRQAAGSSFTFDYTTVGSGGQDYVADPAAALVHWNQALDYALLRLWDRAHQPLAARGVVPVDGDPQLSVTSELLIIQHPQGDPQRAGPGPFLKRLAHDAQRFYHLAPTAAGTSGAPVLNQDNWRAVGLHREEVKVEEYGVSQRRRVATLIGPILADLQQHCPGPYQEIMAAQAALHPPA